MRLLRRWDWLAGVGVATLLAVFLILVGPAQAAFPGRDGLLAVQPLKGLGIVLIKANGGGERRLCQADDACAYGWPLKPAWSPDGRALVVSGAASQVSLTSSSVIYRDGSCLACGYVFKGAGDATFTPNPTLLTAVWATPTGTIGPPGGLVEFSVDGLMRKMLISGPVSDPVWSSRGELAVVRGGWIWVGRPGKLRRLTPGGAPSWSPDGRQMVFDRRGWLKAGPVRSRSFHRLVRGTAPAWSPNGTWIAFFSKRHRLSVVRASGGRVRHVGKVTGRTVDWQPLPVKPPAPCSTPPGSTVTSSRTAVLSVDSVQVSGYEAFSFGLDSWAAMGCLRADGRQRLLISESPLYGPTSVSQAAVAGTYAALAIYSANGKYGGQGGNVLLFNLQTDAEVPDRGGEAVGCRLTSETSCDIDQLVLGSDAVSAVHTTVSGQDMSGNSCSCTVEQVQASDSTGVHTLDSVTEPDGSPTALTNLTLTGDTLTWEHNGTPRSAQLHP